MIAGGSDTRLCSCCLFKPPPPVGDGGGYCFQVVRPCRCPCIRACVRPSVRPSVICGSFMFPRYLQYLSTDFRQTFATGASRDRDELIRFWGQKVKVQGHTIAAEAHSARRYRRVQLFQVVISFTLFWSVFRHRVTGNTQKTHRFLGVKPVEKTSKKPAPNLIQFQFVMPVIIKDVYSF